MVRLLRRQERQHLRFRDAHRRGLVSGSGRAARRAGRHAAAEILAEDDAKRDERSKTLIDIVELAAKFFEAALASRAGASARGYLADRGIDAATQLKFRLGYAPAERFALKEHLGKEGVPPEDMVEAGLLVSGDDIPLPYDRFRERVIFPIADLRGRVIAFGGRALRRTPRRNISTRRRRRSFTREHALQHRDCARCRP